MLEHNSLLIRYPYSHHGLRAHSWFICGLKIIYVLVMSKIIPGLLGTHVLTVVLGVHGCLVCSLKKLLYLICLKPHFVFIRHPCFDCG